MAQLQGTDGRTGKGLTRKHNCRGGEEPAGSGTSEPGDAVFLPAHGRTGRVPHELDAGKGKLHERVGGRYEEV